jgi:hypothetical protein
MHGSRPDHELTAALEHLAGVLRKHLESRPELRETVHALAHVVLEASRETESAGSDAGDPAPADGAEHPDLLEAKPARPRAESGRNTPAPLERQAPGAASIGAVDPSNAQEEPAIPEIIIPRGATAVRPVQLQIGDAKVVLPVEGTPAELDAAEQSAAAMNEPPAQHMPVSSQDEQDIPDLAVVPQRCLLKAEACRFAAHKRRRLEQGADFFEELQPAEYELRGRIEAMDDCYIPLLKRDATLTDDDVLERLARAYENLASIAEPARNIDPWQEDQRRLQIVCDLLARAQSALRRAIEDARAPFTDTDQREAFMWLQSVTRTRRIYTPWMRLDSPFDPNDWPALAADIKRLADDDAQERKRAQGLRRIAYEIEQLKEERGDPERHWRTLLDTLDSLAAVGARASDPEVRRVLAPIASHLPPHLEPGAFARTALRETLRTNIAAADADEEETSPDPMPEVIQTAEALLRGRKALIIGGDGRPQAAEALQQKLGLSELRWLTKRPHGPTSPFESQIARADVDVVFFLARLSNKHDGPEIRGMCRAHGKPCVMLRSGYNPAQVAQQFLQQVSNRFASAGDSTE